VELVDDGTLFLTNFNGTVVADSGKRHLLGSFVIQYDNETVHIGNMSYSSYSATHVMAMPAVLSKVTATGYQLSLKYVHDFSLQNLTKLSAVSNNFLFSILTEAAMILVVALLLYIVWRKITSTKRIPTHRGIVELEAHTTGAEEIVELVDDGTLFLTNFNGTVVADSGKRHLLGSFVIQYDNETVHIGNMSYSSYSATHVMAMPAVLSKVTATGYQLSLKYVHDFSLQNLRKLSAVSNNFLFSILTEAVMTLVVALLLYIVWRKLTSTKCIPTHRGIVELEAHTTGAAPVKSC